MGMQSNIDLSRGESRAECKCEEEIETLRREVRDLSEQMGRLLRKLRDPAQSLDFDLQSDFGGNLLAVSTDDLSGRVRRDQNAYASPAGQKTKQFSLKWKKVSSGRPGVLVEEYPRAREYLVANDLGRSERRSQAPPRPASRGDSDGMMADGARRDGIRPGESACDDDPVGPLVNYLPDSVYLWACGEKCQASDEEVSHSDVLVGWLTLLAQMAGYGVLIAHVDKPEAGTLSIYSVTLAMFLIGSVSASDVRVAVTMIFWSNSGLRRLFGMLLLCSAALLVLATMRILFRSGDSTADMVIDAANVLFIAEVDEQMMLFLHAIPQRWRLFSLLETMGISFWLALITIVHIGSTNTTVSYLTDTSMDVQEIILPFYAFAFTPGTLTVGAFFINFLVSKIPVPTDSRGVPTVRRIRNIGMTLRAVFSGIYAFLMDDLVFALGLMAWVAFGSALATVLSLNILLRDEIPGRYILELKCVVLVCFLIGSLSLLYHKFGVGETPKGSPSNSPPTSIVAPSTRWPVLFVGWGFGSVIAGLLVISTRTKPLVALVGAIPIFLSGVFLFAEPDILGRTIGGVLKPVAAKLGDSHTVLHWALASALHFLMVAWVTDFATYSYFRVIR